MNECWPSDNFDWESLSCARKAACVSDLFDKVISSFETFTALTCHAGLLLNLLKIDAPVCAKIANFCISDFFANTDVHIYSLEEPIL